MFRNNIIKQDKVLDILRRNIFGQNANGHVFSQIMKINVTNPLILKGMKKKKSINLFYYNLCFKIMRIDWIYTPEIVT